MMYPVPFRAEHLLEIDLQPAQRPFADRIALDGARTLEGAMSHTLMADGTPVVCTGAIQFHENHARLWAFLSAAITPRGFGEVHRWARVFVSGLPFRRLEATVVLGFEQGHRWVRSLGFAEESPRMRSFDSHGNDHALYALVRETDG